jgi:uncharacterized surface protein with fasciclin (FAS1) repeats
MFQTKTLSLVLLSTLAVGCSSSGDATTAPDAPAAEEAAEPAAEEADAADAKNIVEVAVGAGSFTTLATALEAAGLVETLQGDGPFTVFAPTDEAFAKLPEGALEDLLANPEQLKSVLLLHVVDGKVTAADVSGLTEAKALSGGMLAVDTSDGVKISGATVTQADVMATNGVIHIIDTVILPQ